MSEGVMLGAIFLVFIICFPLLWVSISLLISYTSGWQKLARHYEISASDLVPDPQIRWQSFSMGYTPFFSASYSSVVNIGIDEIALYLSTIWLFRVGHKTLRIPFEDIEVTDTNILFFKVKRLMIKQSQTIKIYMRHGLVREIERLAVSAV